MVTDRFVDAKLGNSMVSVQIFSQEQSVLSHICQKKAREDGRVVSIFTLVPDRPLSPVPTLKGAQFEPRSFRPR